MGKLQLSEIPLREFESGFARVRPVHPGRRAIDLELDLETSHTGHDLSPDEAYTLGSSLVEHAIECGYDPEAGETERV